MPPLHQAILIITAFIIAVNAAILVAYLINSLAAILGIGFALLLVAPLLLLTLISLPFGWQRPRTMLFGVMKKHPEFGGFTNKLHTMLWQRRRTKAAAANQWAQQY